MVAISYMWPLSTSFSTHSFILLVCPKLQLHWTTFGSWNRLFQSMASKCHFLWLECLFHRFPHIHPTCPNFLQESLAKGFTQQNLMPSHSIYYTLRSMCLIVWKGRYPSFAWCVSIRLQNACRVIAAWKCIWCVLMVWNCHHLPQVSL